MRQGARTPECRRPVRESCREHWFDSDGVVLSMTSLFVERFPRELPDIRDNQGLPPEDEIDVDVHLLASLNSSLG